MNDENDAGDEERYRKQWDPHKHYLDVRVAEIYDAERFASIPGRVFDRLEKKSLRAAFAHIAPGSRVLDCPCGTGRLAELLLELGYHVTGIDISPAMLQMAQRKLARFGSRFETHVGDARRLNEYECRFAAALCARVLMHLPLDEQIEFLRAVASTASVVILTHGIVTPYHGLRRKFKRFLGHPQPAAFPVSDHDISILLMSAGLREVRRISIFPLVSESIIVVAERD